jgi:hypothetical protein
VVLELPQTSRIHHLKAIARQFRTDGTKILRIFVSTEHIFAITQPMACRGDARPAADWWRRLREFYVERNPDHSVNSADNPADAGDIVTVYLTGGGSVNPVDLKRPLSIYS